MSEPHYAIEISKRHGTTCLDCKQPTSRVTGTRNGRPICDVCLLEQEPRLGALIAVHACMMTLADASKPRRPAQAQIFELICEHGEGLGPWLQRGWHSALGDEGRLLTEYDVGVLRDRADTLGGRDAASKLDDLDWIRATITDAKKDRRNVQASLVIAALDQSGKQLSAKDRQTIEDSFVRP